MAKYQWQQKRKVKYFKGRTESELRDLFRTYDEFTDAVRQERQEAETERNVRNAIQFLQNLGVRSQSSVSDGRRWRNNSLQNTRPRGQVSISERGRELLPGMLTGSSHGTPEQWAVDWTSSALGNSFLS